MKNKVFSLTKVIFKNSFQNMETAKSSNENKNKKSKSMIILYIFVFIYLAGIIGVFSNGLIKELIEIKQEEMFLGLILLAIAGLVLIQSIFSAINILYYSKDNEYILPLPIKPSQIVAAKTNVLLITEYFVVVIIGLVPLLIYGILTGANILYYVSMLIVLLTFPVIPALISSLLVLIIMSFAKFTKNRNRFQLIATIILLAIIFAVSFSTSNTETTPEQMAQMVIKANGMVQMLRGAFPTLGMAIDGLTNGNIANQILNLSLLVITTVIIYIVYIEDKIDCINLRKDIYPTLAGIYKKKINNIKCDINYSITSMYDRGNVIKINEYFKLFDNSKPTTKLIIYTILSRIA